MVITNWSVVYPSIRTEPAPPPGNHIAATDGHGTPVGAAWLGADPVEGISPSSVWTVGGQEEDRGPGQQQLDDAPPSAGRRG